MQSVKPEFTKQQELLLHKEKKIGKRKAAYFCDQSSLPGKQVHMHVPSDKEYWALPWSGTGRAGEGDISAWSQLRIRCLSLGDRPGGTKVTKPSNLQSCSGKGCLKWLTPMWTVDGREKRDFLPCCRAFTS